ncbi:TRAP transporter small permease [Saccharospirillum sp.]|uniref:TRAP transporter small permease n=1 Tax=Saccharospirillum sp. TaxID=2033801 RepID=UPI0034A09C3E
MRNLIDWIRKLSLGFNIIGGTALILTMVIVLLEILTRTIFGLTGGSVDLTFSGGFELVRHGMMITFAYSMPYCLARGQVVVDIFTDSWSNRIKAIISGLYTLLFGIFGFLMSFRLVESAHTALQSGETTQDLALPMSTIYYIAAVGMFMLGLRGFAIAWEEIFIKDEPLKAGDTL